MVPPQLASYNATTHLMTFHNGSTIKFGHWSGDASEDEYNGLEYDWIFIDEATQFSERSFNFLGGCLRGVNAFPKRMYLTCNPGGVGHRWVKRLFIDKQYKCNPDNPEENEDPDDYLFIPATVEDNYHLMQSSPGYVRMLASMPEDKRRAYRYGDWDAIGGNYFPEFSTATHVVAPFKIPEHWPLYRSFDYGLDMFACYWWAVDEDGRSWCFREFCEKNLIVQDAAKKIHELTFPNEHIAATYAPPDIWSRQKDTGRTMAETFMLNQIGLIKADNNRVQGHMMMKEALAMRPVKDQYVLDMFRREDGSSAERLPGLMFFDVCKNAINDIQDIQADDKNPNDCAKDPHDVTHTCVTGDTPIVTPDGMVPIMELGDKPCFAWDGSKLVVCEHSPVYMTDENADVFEVELDTGEKIKATAEHPVLTVAGWKKFCDLTPEDDILKVF